MQDSELDPATERAISQAFDEGFQVATDDFTAAVWNKGRKLSISPYAGTDPMLHRWWTRGYWYYTHTLQSGGRIPACLERQ